MLDKKYLLFTLLLVLYLVLVFSVIDFQVGIDFSVYYTSGKMAIEGQASQAYDLDYHHEENEKYWGQEIPFTLGWYYPPIYFFAVLPFALFSLKTGYFIWMIVTFILYLLGLSQLKKPYFLGLGFTGIMLTLLWGQNGFILVFLTAMFIKYMDQPKKAGLFLGLLCFKPHFAILYFVILFLKKEWQILKYTIITGAVLVLVSGLTFGFDTWYYYVQSQLQSGDILIGSNWAITNAIQPSVFSSLVIMGLPSKLAMMLQFMMAVVVVVMISIKWHEMKTHERGILLVLGTFLINPYFLIYDLTLLIVPVVLMADEIWYVRLHKYFLWFLPLMSLLIVQLLHLQIAPLVILSAFIIVIRSSNQNTRLTRRSYV